MRCLVLAGILVALTLPAATAQDRGPASLPGQAQLVQSKPTKTDGAADGMIGAATGGGIGGTARAKVRGTVRGGIGGTPASAAAGSQVLAQAQGGALTVDAVAAYIEALEFSLVQVGQPTRFPQDARAEIAQRLAQAYPSVPVETQRDLARSRAIWTQYAETWETLALEQQREFVYYVLAIYGGEEAAAQALGLNAGGATGSGDDATYGESYYVDPNYEGSDCWASAGCSEYTPGGGYVYEDYNPTTGGYDYNQ